MRRIALTLVAPLLLVACATAEIGSVPASVASAEPPAASATAVVTPEPAATPTTEPTTESASAVTVAQVAEALQASGVEVGEVREMTIEDYGMAPKADEGLRFLLPGLGDDKGGRIMLYEDPEVLERARDYYVELGQQSAMLYSHVFVLENILVQVNGTLPQDQADMLESAINAISDQ